MHISCTFFLKPNRCQTIKLIKLNKVIYYEKVKNYKENVFFMEIIFFGAGNIIVHVF